MTSKSDINHMIRINLEIHKYIVGDGCPESDIPMWIRIKEYLFNIFKFKNK